MPKSIGSNVGSEDWNDKRAKAVKIAEFSKQVEEYNS